MEIPLTKGKVAFVDDDDFKVLSQHKWHAKVTYHGKVKIWYAARTDNKKRKTILMHRVILGIDNTTLKVDHKDHNGLNNRRSNLRISTQAENTRNKSSAIGSSSEFLGVDFMKAKLRWRARIMHNGKTVYLGLFDSAAEAAIAYNNAAKIHGTFANNNSII